MIWATRAHCHVDRAACAWLIARFVDSAAVFVFVEDPDEVPAGAIPFDIRGADLGHHNDSCSFETILERYDLNDQALHEIGKIVHEADLNDELFDAPEAKGLDVLIRGLSEIRSDEDLLANTNPLFDGLYAVKAQQA